MLLEFRDLLVGVFSSHFVITLKPDLQINAFNW